MYTGEILMDLDRGTLAKIDRRILSGLGHDETYRMVRVPVSEATWSTWKRYCDALRISMGRAMVTLVENELQSGVGDWDGQPVFAAEFENRLTERQRASDGKERELEARARRLRENERRIHIATQLPPMPAVEKVGRNDTCPCGSGLKYKRCHSA
jgi:uncharacterized protein YchJ